MANWYENPSWISMSEINGGEPFSSLDKISPSDFNALVTNMQFLYTKGVIDDMNAYDRVGAIYVSTYPESPASLFGGTWQKITDKVLVGAGSNFSAGSTGGKSTHSHSLSSGYAKFLTRKGGYSYSSESGVSEIGSGDTSWLPKYYSTDTTQYKEFTEGYTVATATELGGKTVTESNMPPYLSVHIWQRIA